MKAMGLRAKAADTTATKVRNAQHKNGTGGTGRGNGSTSKSLQCNATDKRRGTANTNNIAAMTSKSSISATTTTNLQPTKCITTTYRSSSCATFVSATTVSMRPQTLNVSNPRDTPAVQTQLFFGDILNVWRAKARCNAVPAERTQELFYELSFHPNEKQISEMLQTAKTLARKGCRHSNGLTFGEFCVLAADLKRFRTSNFAPPLPICSRANLPGSDLLKDEDASAAAGNELRSTKSLSSLADRNGKKLSDASPQLEVFLGGSCNPTTWRADVAIPALQKLGISFYNPQVSDWTPDLIELEHRAKEKARVLFFVMDSETRASAGAIEAAHIAGQNCKQLVLVLHPYKPNQRILNEPISQQEFMDLSRNQHMLRELVARRGLPVLDNIPMALQRTKEILAGARDPPSNIASILVAIRGAFDRVNPVDEAISLEQCQRALSYLGYAHSLLNTDNLKEIVASQRESLLGLQQCSEATTSQHAAAQSSEISYELFCMVSAYLSVLQQEIHENGCVSPIKGTNVPPPPVFLTNMQGDESYTISYFANRNVSRNSSSTSVVSNETSIRDSGTSSPLLLEMSRKSFTNFQVVKEQISYEAAPSLRTAKPEPQSKIGAPKASSSKSSRSSMKEDESDSNDSVFSSSSSISSVNHNDTLHFANLDFRDVYLGGSCVLRTQWRQQIAIPYLKSKGITFHLPALHESILNSQLDWPEQDMGENHDRQDSQDKQTFRLGLATARPNLFNPSLLDSSRVILFFITNDTRSLAPMTLAAHCIGLMYNVVLAVQMLPDDCVIGNEKLTPIAIKDYNRGRSYLIDLAKRQGVPVYSELKPALDCAVERVQTCHFKGRKSSNSQDE